jgi:SAM-dependent methyltransferase
MEQKENPEFWENTFRQKKEMWGMQPAKSAELANQFFLKHQLKNILVPGFGYGRNAQLLFQSGMQVNGIEISQTAIDLAQQHYGNSMVIHHGSIIDMPFDNKKYDGIFCYALIHLLDENERVKLISDCYHQLSPGGYMIFVACIFALQLKTRS